MNILGVDPGLAGGLVVVNDGPPLAYKMPTTDKDLWEILTDIRKLGVQIAVLETVTSSPQMGVTSAFTFGRGYGHLEMGLIAADFRIERVRPQVWQKAMGCLTKGDKNVSKRKAQELFPQVKVTHAIADALLLSEWGRRFLT